MSTEPGRFDAARKAIRDNFNRGAEAYADFEDNTSFFADLLTSLIALSPLPRSGRVLDVGCGTGASLAAISGAVGPGGTVVGLDIALGMLKMARRDLGPGQPLVCGDGCAFSEMFSSSFDSVIYNAVIFLLPDAESSLKSARDSLKPGGSVLLSSLDGVSVDGEKLPDLLAAMGHQAGRHSLSPWPKVEEILTRLFADVTVRSLERPMTADLFLKFYSLEPMSAGLLPRTPYPERLAIIKDAAAKWASEGKRFKQSWILARGVKAP